MQPLNTWLQVYRARSAARTAEHTECSVEAELQSKDLVMAALVADLRRAPSSAVLINYHMGIAGHRPFGGHFSPLVAFHETSRRLLVLDCWPHTEPCWLDHDMVWAAMSAADTSSGLSRGWVVI